MKVKQMFFSWDIWVAILVAAISGFALFPDIPNAFAKEVYNIGISVLAIIFSVYFAALAIIISSWDNDFVGFLQKRGYYERLIFAFLASLIILFTALVYSIFVFSLSAFWVAENSTPTRQSVYWFIGYSFWFAYGLFATISSSIDAIKYTQYRAKFLTLQHEGDNNKKSGNGAL
ncbi:MAG: hypothetical protein EI684_19930 [Candidatus Viridilinea halotolerans]|uniref:Uncharacterized protein n=1 Tax=Candidatus Viridilinea halotolerans TaxID=2491704 RepID=A0A426TSD0_9CHLR|nr:MAG: hypothetical protein EI684_19930 [Candidatus Viridilinea halotolerans]